ncbi:hypothetical protein CFP56_027985 [Quercus suber]|uniref:Uncharacterized protein n=1 Tax=Quercus suber TaxID=58331 RepID=A0AAW0JUK8_QUESU
MEICTGLKWLSTQPINSSSRLACCTTEIKLVDDVVQYKFGEKSSVTLLSSGFSDVTFKSYNGYVEKDSQQKLGHYTIPNQWLL